MKVLHLNQTDISGGASIAGYRLHQGLLNQKIDSRLLVGQVTTKSDRAATIKRKYRIENQIFRVTRRVGLNYLYLISSFDIPQQNFYKNADILNFHNLHSDYFNYLVIPSLTANKPAVYTLHDMWSFTGHCAYSYDCDRWKIGCGKCPYPDIYPGIERDNTHLEWKLKNWIYQHSQLTIVTPSRWLTEQAQKSMFQHLNIHHIPYGIDTAAYQPLDGEKCRDLLGIPKDKKVLLCSGQAVTDSRKGADLLLKSLEKLPASLKAETILMTFGYGGAALPEIGMPILDLGYISGDRLKSIAYSAADLFIFPTRADNLPLMLQESMACGTPMVSFKVGGVPDLVRPGITGYLATATDTEDFAQGIVQLWEDNQLRQQMSQQCRAIAITEYTLEMQAKRYIDLYQQLLEN
ncbi:MAG: glycosyltransferase family 4 protein [Crinalium sp.]